ncbi:MAG: DNA mismatch repair endonuclease MutL [Labilithrix sp.]|nr:DNA mismatch repair endonuclease MutL [Labilithrix sp.]
MGRIEKLSDELANQIAAGEVVERPASIVKELIENALDARATRVTVDVEQGGSALIRVTDDGDGMTPDDALLALERHATSKIKALEDLFHLGTFGFRGEALPSIASVSRLLLRTRARGSDEACEVEIAGGKTPIVRPAGAATGTTLEVRDLFFNVPARRKFLKATATESAHIGDVLLGAALARPDVTFTLSRDKRVVREYLRAGTRAERARVASSGENLAHVVAERGPLRLEAMLAAPERARSGATGLTLLVNGRPVRDRVLARAVAHAYGSVLEGGRYPVGVVWLDLPTELVDINVHPQKAEVRFTDARGVFDAITRELHGTLARAFGLPDVGNPFAHARPTAPMSPVLGAAPRPPVSATGATRDLFSRVLGSSALGSSALGATSSAQGAPGASARSGDGAGPSDSNAGGGHPAAPGAGDGHASAARATTARHDPLSTGPVTLLRAENLFVAEGTASAPPFQRPGLYTTLRYIGQVHATFLVCEGDDGLYVLDQHAAAERVTFDRLRRAFASRSIAVQRLLVPEVVDLPPSDVAVLEEHADDVTRLGVEVRAVGDAAVAVHGVPTILARAEPARVVADLVSELSRAGGRAFGGAIDLVLATMACHGSIRAGDSVSPEEARALLDALDEVDFAGHCPHGRPVVMRLGWTELERRVGR